MLLKGLLQQLEFCISRITMLLASKVWGSCRQAALCISPLLTDIKDVGSGMNQSHVSPLLMLKRETGSPCLPLVWISMAHSLVYSPPPSPHPPLLSDIKVWQSGMHSKLHVSLFFDIKGVWACVDTTISSCWHQRCGDLAGNQNIVSLFVFFLITWRV